MNTIKRGKNRHHTNQQALSTMVKKTDQGWLDRNTQYNYRTPERTTPNTHGIQFDYSNR